MIQLRKLCVTHDEMRAAYIILVGKSQWETRREYEYNINV